MGSFLIPGIVFILACLVVAFIKWYWFPSRRLYEVFITVIPAIKSLKPIGGSTLVSLDRVEEILKIDSTLEHLWSEYTETLHEQYDYVDGERRLVAIRATVPAEVFFNTQVLVDTPLNTEFFRHLPGMLTGIGIIGTFAGLIFGLSGFEPTGSAEVVKASLGSLLGGVNDAFIASAVAIAFAMGITLLEKYLLNILYKQVEELTQAIDSLFEAGAGEEYLARLVKATEEGADQTKQLKQSLVDDLRQILTDLTDRQIHASQQHSQRMAQDVGTAIEQSLQAPLQKIADVVAQASGQQGTAVQSILENVLTAFMAKIEDTFGGQMHGLNEMMSQSVGAMREMQSEFGKLVADLRQVGQSSAEEMSIRLTDMLEKTEERQSAMVAQMSEFLAEVRKSTGETQASNRLQMEETLQSVQVQLGGMATMLEQQRAAANLAEEARHSQLTTATNSMVEGIQGEVERLVKEVTGATMSMERNIAALQSLTTTAIDRMNTGAETMYLAAGEFKEAGGAVAGAMNAGASTMAQLESTAQHVNQSTSALSSVLADYQRTRDSMTQMTVSLQALVDAARREAGVSKQMVDDLQQAAAQLSAAEREAGAYLVRVNDTLGRSFTAFGEAVSRELGRSNAAFQSELGKATGMLGAAYQELAAVMGQPKNGR